MLLATVCKADDETYFSVNALYVSIFNRLNVKLLTFKSIELVVERSNLQNSRLKTTIKIDL